MRLHFMYLAKFAEISDGLITAIGATWDTTTLPIPPDAGGNVRIMRGVLVARVLLDDDELDVAHQVRFRLRSAGGSDVAMIEASFAASAMPGFPEGWEVGAPLAIDLTGIPLPGVGVYDIQIDAGDRQLGTTRFRVIDL